MKVVAFMQNMWVRDPARAKAMIEQFGEEYRLRLIAYALFAGCVSGQRLRKVFGEMVSRIVWEESTREIGGVSSSVFPPDPEHIAQVLAKHAPAVVLTFGKVAAEAVRPLWAGPMIEAPHPAARGIDTMPKLRAAAAALAEKMGGGC